MKQILAITIIHLLASSAIPTSYASEPEGVTKIKQGSFIDSIPGEFEVRRASTRPATRAMQLLYACAIDDYAAKHREDLERLPYALRCVRDNETSAIQAFRNYTVQYPKFSPDGDAAKTSSDVKALRWLQDSGYKGTYAKELEDFIKLLESKV